MQGAFRLSIRILCRTRTPDASKVTPCVVLPGSRPDSEPLFLSLAFTLGSPLACIILRHEVTRKKVHSRQDMISEEAQRERKSAAVVEGESFPIPAEIKASVCLANEQKDVTDHVNGETDSEDGIEG